MNPDVVQPILSRKRIAYARVDAVLCLRALGGDDTLLGLVPGDVGQPLVVVVPELFGSEDQLHAVMAGELPLITVPRVNRDGPDGDVCYLDLSVFPSRDEDAAGLLVVAEDVTELARAEQMLTQQRNELALLRDRLAEQNLALAAANAELRQLDQLKSRFVTIAAHELRSPLATISGYVDLLFEEDICGPLSDMQRTSLDVINRSTARLLHMVANLLDLTRIEAGRLDLTLQPVEISPLVHQVLRELKPLAEDKRHALEITVADDLPLALCDGERAVQVLHNLVANAIKYTPDGGHIAVVVCCDQEPTFIRFQVSDSGIGIPHEEQQRLFEAFFRAGNVYQVDAGGSGLGLGIARSLVELHGGALWFESTPGEGSHFYFTLPIDEPD